MYVLITKKLNIFSMSTLSVTYIIYYIRLYEHVCLFGISTKINIKE